MLTQFPGRTQKQLKNKFKKESKERPDLIDFALSPKVAAPLSKNGRFAFAPLSASQPLLVSAS